jgi:hypothetical protein
MVRFDKGVLKLQVILRKHFISNGRVAFSIDIWTDNATQMTYNANCRNPTLKEVWGRHSHSRKWDLGVFRDSQKLITQLQGSKHLASKCSLYCWKGLEVWMSEMASHEPFGHLQNKLWLKEGSGVKLAVWLPTTKSRESTRCRCV